jgi:hypothetical protein
MTCAIAAPMPEEFPRHILNDVEITRGMTITYAPGDAYCNTPMLKLANNYLRDVDFEIGDSVSVHYKKGEIIIRKI